MLNVLGVTELLPDYIASQRPQPAEQNLGNLPQTSNRTRVVWPEKREISPMPERGKVSPMNVGVGLFPGKNNNYFERLKTVEQGFGSMPYPSAMKEACLRSKLMDPDDPIVILRTRIHEVRAKCGTEPLAKAHKLALDTFKEFDAEWDTYLKEEARRQSVREED